MSQLGIEVGCLGAAPLGGQHPGHSPVGSGDCAAHRSWRLTARALAYPRHYLWVLGLAILDIGLTSLVLSTGGRELNAIARYAIERAGVFGMIGIKALTLMVIIGICEYVGPRRPVVGRRIAEFALAANSVAVACGLVYVTQFTLALLQLV